ncbi:dynactin-associated protein [Mantella aurantiaca]
MVAQLLINKNICELEENASLKGKMENCCRCWEPWKTFLACALMCAIATAIGVLATVFALRNQWPTNSTNGNTESPSSLTTPPITTPSNDQKICLEYLYSLWKVKIETFEGGGIRCARYRESLSNYSSLEERLFGTSIHKHQSGISFCVLYLRPGGLRVPHWNLQAHVHGFVIQGTVWVGIISNDGESAAVTFNVTCGQVFFVPRLSLHWIKNIGNTRAIVALYFSTHEEYFTTELDVLLSEIDEDILVRALMPLYGMDFIQALKRNSSQVITLGSIHGVYPQSPSNIVSKYFLDLEGERKSMYNNVIMTWAQFYGNTTGLTQNTIIYGSSIFSHQSTLSLGVVTIKPLGLLGPYYNLNAHEMAYVLQGCGKVAITSRECDVVAGDVIYFPIGLPHYLKNTCGGDFIIIRAFSIPGKVETLFMDYFYTIPVNILSNLFHQPENIFIPAIRYNITFFFYYGNICKVQPGTLKTTSARVPTKTTTTTAAIISSKTMGVSETPIAATTVRSTTKTSSSTTPFTKVTIPVITTSTLSTTATTPSEHSNTSNYYCPHNNQNCTFYHNSSSLNNTDDYNFTNYYYSPHNRFFYHHSSSFNNKDDCSNTNYYYSSYNNTCYHHNNTVNKAGDYSNPNNYYSPYNNHYSSC